MSQKLNARAKTKVTFGKYVLDSLSVGMYSDPLTVLREYLQNSADSIDLLSDNPIRPIIEININGRSRSLEISDNGIGIPAKKARNALLNIGASEKDNSTARGFRGIGRLGGLGYCDELVFITKSQGEQIVTTCTWNSKLLRQLINDKLPTDTNYLINEVTNIKTTEYEGSAKDHYFKVQMHNINDSRNILLNVPAIKSYLSQVAPAPFNPAFNYSESIDKKLSENVPSYRTYQITVNKEPLFKPYLDSIKLSRESSDFIKAIQYVELRNETDLVAFGWVGQLELLGTINPTIGIDGIRLRCGNILLGDRNTLSTLYKESRFNHYLVGEIHSVTSRLIPNSRRDDFEDSQARSILYNEFIKEIGIPYSLKIRELSKERGQTKQKNGINTLFEEARVVINYGYLSPHQRDRIVEKLSNINGSHSPQEIEIARRLINEVSETKDILSTHRISQHPKAKIIDILYASLDIIYAGLPNSSSADNLRNKLSILISGK